LGGCQFKEAVADSLVEVGILTLQIVACCATASRALSGIEIKQDREIGGEGAGSALVQARDQLERQSAAVVLIGDGRVREAIADDKGAALERGSNHVRDELGSCGLEYQEFSGRVSLVIGGFKQGCSQALSQGRTARFAGENDLAANGLRSLDQGHLKS
jgi:hypothetical protein